MSYSIHKYVFVGVQSPESKNYFVFQAIAFGGFSSTVWPFFYSSPEKFPMSLNERGWMEGLSEGCNLQMHH